MGKEVNALFDHGDGYPRSRDYGLDNFKCKQKLCVCNYLNSCMSPARCVIGENGKCEGFMGRKEEK